MPLIVSKNLHNRFLGKSSFSTREPHMRIAKLIFVGSIAALAGLTPPALANNSDTRKIADQSTSSPCQAYQQAPDGTWKTLPCQEMGAGSGGQPQRKSATRSSDQETR
jgi:hypothetical protein